ncbi:MAG: histidinol-phosphate transaminase [Spongiibacteraceae bacterium]|nr:histidinol-phosphate transaminase [Spongiibacteraceae bacterium]
MSMYWSEIVSQLEPYVPGEQPKQADLIKLNTNENPYPPSLKVQQALSGDLLDSLRLYPDPDSSELKKSVANYHSVKPENVFVGNGSDEVLALAFMAFFQQNKPLLFPDITYSFYPVYCRLYGIDYKTIPLANDFTIDINTYKQPNGGIIFPNPNAPTSIGMPLASIETLLNANLDSVVIIDEAYIDFGGQSASCLINRYPNVLVVQTLSKSRSLAGLRVGFALGDVHLINGLNRVKDSFNSYPLDTLAQTAAKAAIDDIDYFRECNDKIIATRQWTTQALQSLGFKVLPSQANFVFVRPVTIDAAVLFARLRDKNILVRYFNKARVDQFLRITIGTDQQMQALVTALEQILTAS